MSPEDAAKLSGQTVHAQLVTSGPAAQPPAKPEQAAPAADDSTEKRLEHTLGAYHQDAQNQPRQGESGALFPPPGEEQAATRQVEMGPVLAAGAQGLEKGEPAAPKTDPFSILTQVLGSTTDKQTILDNLMEISADTSIITSVKAMEELFSALTRLELTFPADEDIQGSLIFARAILRVRYIELQGRK